MPRAFRDPRKLQSRMKPADGGSKATGGPAMAVHTSQSASGVGTCEYWIGRPWRARPSQISPGEPSKRIRTSRGCQSVSSTVAPSGPRMSRSPAVNSGGGGRSSVGVRKSPAPKTTAIHWCTASAASELRPARRTSMGRPLGPCAPRRLAGSVAASFAISRSPLCKRSMNFERGQCCNRPLSSTRKELRATRALDWLVRGFHR